MKKIIAMILAAVLMIAIIFSLTACGNMQIIDTTYTFDHAIISLPDGSIVVGDVDSWGDYENSDQIQVVVDGVVYLVHSSNIVLVND